MTGACCPSSARCLYTCACRAGPSLRRAASPPGPAQPCCVCCHGYDGKATDSALPVPAGRGDAWCPLQQHRPRLSVTGAQVSTEVTRQVGLVSSRCSRPPSCARCGLSAPFCLASCTLKETSFRLVPYLPDKCSERTEPYQETLLKVA